MRLVGPKPNPFGVGDGWPVDIPAPVHSVISEGGTRSRTYCPGLEVRVLVSGGGDRKIRHPGETRPLGQGEAKGLHLTRTWGKECLEKPLVRGAPTVPQTDTGRRVEDTQARERTLVKELGKLTP